MTDWQKIGLVTMGAGALLAGAVIFKRTRGRSHELKDDVPNVPRGAFLSPEQTPQVLAKVWASGYFPSQGHIPFETIRDILWDQFRINLGTAIIRGTIEQSGCYTTNDGVHAHDLASFLSRVDILAFDKEAV